MVADLAGVSTATVSYVFSGRDGGASGVTEETTSRVLAAAEKLNYRPNRAARAIRTGKTGIVELSLHMLSDPWSIAVAEAVSEACKPHGLTALILPDDDWATALDRVESDLAFVGMPREADTLEGRALLRRLVDRGQRLVVYSETLEPDGYDVVRSDSLPGCVLVVDHLLERHADVGCLTAAHLYNTAGPNRYTVFLDRMAAAGRAVNPANVAVYDGTPEGAFDSTVELLSRDDRPTALYATTDFAALAAMNAAHMLGLRVPHDIAIAGVGNTPQAQRGTPTLTTVGPRDFYSRQADLIVARALDQGPDTPILLTFEWELIRGASTDLDTPPRRPPHTPNQ